MRAGGALRYSLGGVRGRGVTEVPPPTPPPRMTDWETAPAVTETPDIKLFGKWSTDDVQINDISLQVMGGGAE